jgi:hypothetical protein
VVFGSDSAGFAMTLVDSGGSGAVSACFCSIVFVEFLSTMMMTFSDHPEASAWPLSLLFFSFLLFTLFPVNDPSLVAREGVD